MILDPVWADCFRRARLASARLIMDTNQGRVVASDGQVHRNDVLLVEFEKEGKRTRFFIKRSSYVSVRKIFKRVFRGGFFPPSKVRKEYSNLKRLQRLGFDVPELIGYGEERRWGALLLEVLVTREIPDVFGLDFLIQKWLPSQPPRRQREVRRRLLERLADVTRRMHACGFEHHDCFFRNLMVSKDDLDRVFILDCPRGSWWPTCLMSWRGQLDLATLDAASGAFCSRTDRLRFFLRYRQHRRLTGRDKRMIRKVLDRAAPMRERQLIRLRRFLRVNASEDAGDSKPANLEKLANLMVEPDACHAENQEHPRL